ncbi:hypothetical protein AB0J72_23355 [Dactylosporangium sp. NPDC049742]|uniref:hypothetical protein n=1 Tax=Dactylosporangium sp. NPDC049742 TaxID=3154737 RepID=UPI00342919F0
MTWPCWSTATEHIAAPDKVVAVHCFIGSCDWWICEYEPETCTAYGYTCLGDPDGRIAVES